jgi:hypothetical protein
LRFFIMKRFATLSAIALIAVAPAAVQAQSTSDEDAAVAFERAELLTEQAYIAAGLEMDFANAATWLRDAASLRGDDAAAVRLLLDAGHFHFYAQRSLKAASAFNEAAELAIELGDREVASVAYRNAAFAADRAGDIESARSLMARSQQLAVEATIVAADFGQAQTR